MNTDTIWVVVEYGRRGNNKAIDSVWLSEEKARDRELYLDKLCIPCTKEEFKQGVIDISEV